MYPSTFSYGPPNSLPTYSPKLRGDFEIQSPTPNFFGSPSRTHVSEHAAEPRFSSNLPFRRITVRSGTKAQSPLPAATSTTPCLHLQLCPTMADWLGLGHAGVQGSPGTSTTAWIPWRRLLTVARCACPLIPSVPRAWAYIGRYRWSGFLSLGISVSQFGA